MSDFSDSIPREISGESNAKTNALINKLSKPQGWHIYTYTWLSLTTSFHFSVQIATVERKSEHAGEFGENEHIIKLNSSDLY
jgi:hypothetical protein